MGGYGGAAAARGADGRFLPGCSGNPAGKRPGTRNRATLLAEMLAEGEAPALIRALVDKALGGDAVALRFCAGHLLTKPSGRAIRLELPDWARPSDVVAGFNATFAAMAAGEITPEEALTVTRVLEGRVRALEAWRLERFLTWDGAIPGERPPTKAKEEDDEDDEDDFEDEDDELDDESDNEDDEENDDEDEAEDIGGAVTPPPAPQAAPSPARPAAAAPPSPAAAPGRGGADPARLEAICATLEAAQAQLAGRRPGSALHRAMLGAERAG